METPVYDFITKYIKADKARLHMPGHKGVASLGPEAFDITEVSGADSLYEADGIISVSEKNATELFGSGRTVYSTEGSTQCVKAMLFLASLQSGAKRPLFVAARNVHKSFVFGAAFLDARIRWIYPEKQEGICSCTVTPERLEKTLASLKETPAGVYVTSPDYLGNMCDIRGLADVCARFGTLLLVDNAHGSYLHFLKKPLHPMDLGADICRDSAHKTLPVLTGG
ncbi:MAG: PLP-dependent transferase, partial [Lachnospiraceae bacterium]|nr:PLP-dependent transferase [Lachnospiraceae bacterium]